MTNEHSKSDAKLIAACILLGIEAEEAEERAGILEFDGGLPRDIANRESLYLRLNQRGRRHSRKFSSDFFNLASNALEHERKHGWSRSETIEWVVEYLEKQAAV